MYHVVEFGSYYAASFLGTHLLHMGCTVTSVVRPAGTRGAMRERDRMGKAFAHVRNHKHCRTLDMRTDRDEIERLVRECDILVENFANGVMSRHGFGYEDCLRLNPSIVYVSMPGFVEDELPGWEPVILAKCGMLHDIGINRMLRGQCDNYTTLLMASTYASCFAFFAVSRALMSDPLGDHIVVPLASCVAEAMVHNTISLQFRRSVANPRKQTLHDKGAPIDETELNALQCPMFQKYKCADARFVYLVCPSHLAHQKRALALLGIDATQFTCDERSFIDRADGLGATRVADCERANLRACITQAFATRDAEDWETLFGRHGVPAAVIRSAHEWVECDHAVESGLFLEDGLGAVGWFTSEERRARCTKGLAETVVLDMTNVIAGPTVGLMFARAGARVVKVDPRTPSYAPDVYVTYGVVTNAGKESILVDRDEAVFSDLVRGADLVIMNATHDSLSRLRINISDLREMNPDIVLMHFDAWSGPRERGRFRNHTGYDDTVQAGTGFMVYSGGSHHQAEEHSHIGTIDVCAGIAAAAVSMWALLRRRAVGVTSVARSSLATITQFMQIKQILRIEGDLLRRSGRVVGESASRRVYRTRDSAVLVCSDGPLPALSEDRFMNLETRDAVRYLCRLGAFATSVVSIEMARAAFRTDRPSSTGSSLQFVWKDSDGTGRYCTCAFVAVRMRGMRFDLDTAPKFGTHTTDVVRELTGHSVDARSWSPCYWPEP